MKLTTKQVQVSGALALMVALLFFGLVAARAISDAQKPENTTHNTAQVFCYDTIEPTRLVPCGTHTNGAIRGHQGIYVEKETSPGKYEGVIYTPDMCLLPSVDENYTEDTPLCVNSGKAITQKDADESVFADMCEPGGYVPCQ